MQIEKRFIIDAPVERVWQFLIDPHQVASCLPGAAITDQVDDRTFGGTMKMKVGPVSAAYKGRIRFERLDPGAKTAEMVATGQETRGKGGAQMKMTSRLVELDQGGTEVHVTSDVEVTGILAQFGRGMIEDVSDQMFERFTTAVRAKLEGNGAAEVPEAAHEETLDVGSIGVEAGKRAIGRAVRRLTGREHPEEPEGKSEAAAKEDDQA